MQRAHKALNRVRGAKLLLSFGERRITMQAVMKMLSNVQEQREMERMADEMYEILKERRVVRAFQAMRGYVNLQKDQRDRLLHVDLYYD
jgi:tRNA nucleotidyltransferase/poly(A) polymerase